MRRFPKVSGTHTIQYIVTDPAGKTGTATRTVIVAAANDNQEATTTLPTVGTE